MSESGHAPAGRRARSGRGPHSQDAPDPEIDPRDTLTLLSDEYARDILDQLGDEALPAREIHRRLDVSRATVYRRLDRLESAGLVESSMGIHPEGHHRERYTRTTSRIQVSFGQDGPMAAGG